ncbi:redoxin domain-containing protein [Pedobacter sp. MR2016-19]|uniref:redoxin domain-containing protein n=1 Tax=Pedobacter sp. MR2016-19 TaxID=2780089 RepID=UPI001876A4A0|nr:redoxin domain-containing protein [Pedobacter sp. MR2016-19]MBE5319204.1 redoxin domain-containing protein [Pedobacter sp. MR2016-19]
MKLFNVFFGLSFFFIVALAPLWIRAQENLVSAKKLKTIKLINLNGRESGINLDKSVVIVFLSPECPLCKNYLPGLVNLRNSNKSINFYGVISGTSYSLKEINKLKNEYGINFDLLIDRDKGLSKYLGATTTPEVFLINKMGAITYSGLIDNWSSSLGQKRLVITEKYLEEAIKDLSNGKQIFKKTIPVGCLINDI